MTYPKLSVCYKQDAVAIDPVDGEIGPFGHYANYYPNSWELLGDEGLLKLVYESSSPESIMSQKEASERRSTVQIFIPLDRLNWWRAVH